MNVYLDDVRTEADARQIALPRGQKWTIVRTYEECVSLLETGTVEYMSLDHDLGTEKTGYDVVKWIEEKVWTERFDAPRFHIHSANPVGRRNMELAIQSIQNEMDTRVFLGP